MADFYIDHDVSADVSDLLQHLGHNAPNARDLQLADAHDGLHLLNATRRQAILVSHNGKDFRLLHRAWECWTQAWGITEPHAGVLILPHGAYQDSVARLLEFLQAGHPLPNMVYRYQPWRGWEPFV